MRLQMKSLLTALSLALPLAACMAPDPGPSTPGTVVSSTDAATQAEALKKAGVGTKVAADVGLKPAAVDSSKRFEYKDVYVNVGDPEGQKQLAYYFYRQEVWTIDKSE